MKFTTVRELKAKTSAVLHTVEKGDTVLVTTHGRPTAMLAYSPTLRKKIEEGLKDIRAGRTMSLADYARRRMKLKANSA